MAAISHLDDCSCDSLGSDDDDTFMQWSKCRMRMLNLMYQLISTGDARGLEATNFELIVDSPDRASI